MSLINDALKKAQKLQTEQPAAVRLAPAAPFSVRAAGRPSAVMSFERILLVVVTLVVVVVGATAVAVLLLRRSDRSPVAKAAQLATPAPARSPAAATAPANVSADTTTVAAPPAGPAVSAAPATPTATREPVPAPMVSVSAAGPPAAATAPAAVSPPAPAGPAVAINFGPPPSPAHSDVESAPARAARSAQAATKPVLIRILLENARVAGVRVAGDDSKVLMNDRVYRVNDVVNVELGLRLTGVGTSALTFVDEDGRVYTKTF
ncbi:MAG TPA: hypothetical protein VFC28_04515 [Opitutaceae bacterium]|nr:hypothetical protein [Opitutaceae bacterium]